MNHNPAVGTENKHGDRLLAALSVIVVFLSGLLLGHFSLPKSTENPLLTDLVAACVDGIKSGDPVARGIINDPEAYCRNMLQPMWDSTMIQLDKSKSEMREAFRTGTR